VSGKLAYCVYMDDKNGSQDVYVATTTSGTLWKKNVVVDSVDDELYPVISANGNEAICMFTKNNDLYVTSTKDAGATWSDPVKVNDDTGSVISEYGASDIVGAYGFWASNRTGNNDIFFEEVGKVSEIVFGEISGGFGFTVTLSNVGNADAETVPWSIAIDGHVFTGSEKSGTISIPAGGSAIIKSGFIFAIGKLTITIIADSKTMTFTAFALGPFLLHIA
jgi:Neuraminidase (sialidase)